MRSSLKISCLSSHGKEGVLFCKCTKETIKTFLKLRIAPQLMSPLYRSRGVKQWEIFVPVLLVLRIPSIR